MKASILLINQNIQPMKNLQFFLSFLTMVLLFSCNKQEDTQTNATPSPDYAKHFNFDRLKNIQFQLPEVPAYTGVDLEDEDDESAAIRATHEVAPGHNQLQGIIDNASAGDKIVLLEGLHTEDETIVINRRIRLEGEDGAVLSLGGVVGIFVIDARKTSIKNLEITNAGTAYFGVAVESTNLFDMQNNVLTGFAYSVVLEDAWKLKVKGNTIVGAGAANGALGITVVNGNRAEVSDNTVSNNQFGIWACDRDGKAEDNVMYGNLIGLILCKVPAGSFSTIFSSGTGGAEHSATNWKVEDNLSHDNVWGYMVIDGAKDNTLEDNEGYNNAFVDIELLGETNQLFGFFTPTSEGNEVDANGLNYIDCGLDNEVENGVEANLPCSI
jgi:parallel beta-helix repeat protein